MEPRGREGSCPWQDKAAEDANVHFRPPGSSVSNTQPRHLTMELEMPLEIQLIRLTESYTWVAAAASVIWCIQK